MLLRRSAPFDADKSRLFFAKADFVSKAPLQQLNIRILNQTAIA